MDKEEFSIMPNRTNKHEWNALVSRFVTMCYGCGNNIKKTQPIMNNSTYKVSMHVKCYIQHLRELDE